MSIEAYPFDPEVRRRVTELLYELLPALYRMHDEPPNGQGHLKAFLSILAAPLAEVRQSIEELHADFFIDSSSDEVLPYLAEMVGTTLLFRDAASNRRDVRGTARWRRRKGAPSVLEELGSELFNRTVVTQEGWKRLLLMQDVNLHRLERTVPDIRNALLPEISTGPLDAIFHAADVRPASERGGRYHPGQITHWTYPTQSFPVRQGTARRVSALPEQLYTFHPRGVLQPLRLQRVSPEDRVLTDRVPEMAFSVSPEDYFGKEGRFTVRICGMAAAVGKVEPPARTPSVWSAEPELMEAPAQLTLLTPVGQGLTGPMNIELCAVPISEEGVPRPDDAVPLGGLSLERSSVAVLSQGAVALRGPLVAMLRISTAPPDIHGFFPGATLELVSGSSTAQRASTDEERLAVEGFLRGALIVEIPRMWLERVRWLYVAADGSLYDAGSNGQWVSARPFGARYQFDGQALSVGPGPAWPPAPYSASDERMTRVIPSPGRGPVFMHGGRALMDSAPGAPGDFALVFAARYLNSQGQRGEPFLKLAWDAAEQSWVWGAIKGQLAPTVPVGKRLSEIAELKDKALGQLQLVVWLEAAQHGLVLPPCEVAWPADDGETVLLHLPEQIAEKRPSGEVTGPVILLGSDGSSRVEKSGVASVARFALGTQAVAPIGGTATLRRRQLRGQSLSLPASAGPPPQAGERRGFLDVDPVRGLLALDEREPPVDYPHPEAGYPPRPPSVTVDYQEGSSSHIGARSAPRDSLLSEQQPRPTRLVVGRALYENTRENLALDIYPSLTDALRAIDEDPDPADHEVIQFEDSATYEEAPVWPHTTDLVLELGVFKARERGPQRLTIQAAEAERPVLHLQSWRLSGRTHYQQLTLRGLSLGGSSIVFPPADVVTLQFCTVAEVDNTGSTLAFGGPDVETFVHLSYCMTSELTLQGSGTLDIQDSIVHGTPRALHVPAGTCQVERTTVMGDSEVHILDASESIFDGDISVTDRFHGCVRYSRVPDGCPLPVTHQETTSAVRFVTRDRNEPAYARLAADCDPLIARGAEDGSEMGAFHGARLAQRYEALARRLSEYTPAGLVTGICRLD